ncbi:hypothetical protein PHYBLDRAFT_61730 [Phycomyces blakesleeanus NRRL 1555(-)]|uniref:Uncharacterized protein n=1 Tax=Phycomyces blakesleeanus (strain ATCC 8743b / DSM 1359 / FGSC 10004 / NBRC 33097 / NRRL 1555) TaxID=763407 RepID=A0A162V7S0_PHYB8|nr:hypothetical protein PHYBLDRAFT_61730 [Phycomyces blakesleeanus NRRL 1555(-)]OAD80673.1 hypothetical protein PHYBLDRAFT_61730 [Phycomyces blakesleeanus NRRL 1555(-)]|eukprot:XP_018298713.1 hypothetical protein PHYBLDRAFT_61730 [Phycomyces blakesleeanus NRRL 1555(-)]
MCSQKQLCWPERKATFQDTLFYPEGLKILGHGQIERKFHDYLIQGSYQNYKADSINTFTGLETGLTKLIFTPSYSTNIAKENSKKKDDFSKVFRGLMVVLSSKNTSSQYKEEKFCENIIARYQVCIYNFKNVFKVLFLGALGESIMNASFFECLKKYGGYKKKDLAREINPNKSNTID